MFDLKLLTKISEVSKLSFIQSVISFYTSIGIFSYYLSLDNRYYISIFRAKDKNCLRT